MSHQERHQLSRAVLSVTFASALTLQLVGLPIRVFSRAVTSHANYGFYGVQMGQREVFSWVRRNLDRDTRRFI
jgi:hypothetical protein